jgi:tRNA A37 threonylcarbamoyladenosine modification protein TsaB
LKVYNLLIDAPFTGGRVVVFTTNNNIVSEKKLSSHQKHSVSLFVNFMEFKKEGFFDKLGKIYFNIGPGNFSSLRVIGSSAFGLLSGLDIDVENLYGFSYLDFLAWKNKHIEKTEMIVAIEDNRNNWVGATYLKEQHKLLLSQHYWRKPKDSMDLSPDIVLSKEELFSVNEIVSYLNSLDYIYRNPWQLLYYQKSYFER